MRDGVYYVIFSRHYQIFGQGTIVVINNVINGGDLGFMYQGVVQGNDLALQVYQHDYKVPSIFRGVPEFRFNLTIDNAPYGYDMEGNVEGIASSPISIKAKYIGAPV